MALHQAKPIEAVTASTSMPAEQTEALITSVPSLLEKLTGMDIPTNHMTKLVCHDPWVSFIVTVITIVGVVVYVYRSCRPMSFLKGHKFASICHVHIIFRNNTRYVPLKIGHYIGSISIAFGTSFMLNGMKKGSTTKTEASPLGNT